MKKRSKLRWIEMRQGKKKKRKICIQEMMRENRKRKGMRKGSEGRNRWEIRMTERNATRKRGNSAQEIAKRRVSGNEQLNNSQGSVSLEARNASAWLLRTH